MTSAKGKRIKPRTGDVFLVPVSSDEHVYGQVIDQDGPQHLVVLFRSNAGAVDEVAASGIELAGIVFDAKFRNGDWPIVANWPPVKVETAWFVLGHEGLENLRVENFDRSETRMVRPAAAVRHRHRHISYPMALQWAAEAIRGHREWNADLDCYRDLALELSGLLPRT